MEDIAKDYGEDLFVRIFEHGVATPLSFFVQAKATNNIARYLNIEGTAFHIRLDREHLDHWNRFHEPVILTIWDSQSDNTYWTCVQNAAAQYNGALGSRNQRTGRIAIACNDQLNEAGLMRLHFLTQTRHNRINREGQGSEILTSLLESKLNLKVDYSPESGVVILEEQDGNGEVLLFGKSAPLLLEGAARLGMSPQRAFEAALDELCRLSEEHTKTDMYPVMNRETGRVEKTKMTVDQLRHHVLSVLERIDEDVEG